MKQTVRLVLLCLTMPLMLTACTTTYDCEGVRAYMYAEQFPALKNPPGLNVPPPDPSMDIPDVAGGPVRRYDNAPDDARLPDGVRRNELAGCLIAPPPPVQAGMRG